jgi:hypothetical protein
MLERTLEIALSRFPELLDETWTLEAQQLAIGTGILDLMFKGADGILHLVEVKKGPATTGAVAQVLGYANAYRSHGLTVTPWVVAHEIPTAVATLAADNGVRTRAISPTYLEAFVGARGESIAGLMHLRRRTTGALSGGGGDLWREVSEVEAFGEIAVPIVAVLRRLAARPDYRLKTGAMQTTIWYRGVKIGGFNRKHRGGRGYVTSGILSPALRRRLEVLGFEWMEKQQAGSKHVHTWMEVSARDAGAFESAIEIAQAAIDAKFGQSPP